MKKLILPLIASIGMMACSDDIPVQKNVEYQTLVKGNDLKQYNDLNHNLNLVISNSVEFENFATQVGFDTTNFPQINYNESIIIAVLGKLNASGSDYEVLNIVQHNNVIKVNTKEVVYDSSVMSKPFHIVKINKTDKSVIFN